MTPDLCPPIEQSVLSIGPNTYQLGSMLQCKKATHAQDEAAIATWTDSDGEYCLVDSVPGNAATPKMLSEGLIYQAGMSSAVWRLGCDAICKVKTWCDGMELESSTLAFAQSRFPNIPVPRVIHAWVDKKLRRTFLILRRIPGQSLDRAWPSLTNPQRERVAVTVAQYCRDLAGATSQNLQSATGCGVLEPFLNVRAEDDHPTWMPRLLGPLSRALTEKYLRRISTQPMPCISDEFHFYHADLGPTNIIISDDGVVEGILDWESAGFYPKFWIPLKPYRSRGFNLEGPSDSCYAWVDLLISKLSDMGFELDPSHVKWHKTLCLTYFDIGEISSDSST